MGAVSACMYVPMRGGVTVDEEEGEAEGEGANEETASVASDSSEPPLTCRERCKILAELFVRDWPGQIAALVVVLWLVDGLLSRHGWYAWFELAFYGNYENER